MLQEGGADWQAPLVPGTLLGTVKAYVTREGGILAPFFYPEAVLQPKAVGSGEEGQGSRLFPHPQLEVGGLGPGHPEDAMPTSGQEGGRGGGVEGVPGPGPSGLESPRGRGRGGSERAGGGLLGAGSAPSGAGLKGGKARAGDWSQRKVHLNRGVARAQP